MNTHDKYELPPLPETDDLFGRGYSSRSLMDYARAAIEANQRRLEYEYRKELDRLSSRNYYLRMKNSELLANRQAKGEPVAYRYTEHDAVRYVSNPKHMSASAVDAGIVPEPLFSSPQPTALVVKESLTDAEPVKVPSDSDLLFALRTIDPHLKDVEAAIPALITATRLLLKRYGQPARARGEPVNGEELLAAREALIDMGCLWDGDQWVEVDPPSKTAEQAPEWPDFARMEASLQRLKERLVFENGRRKDLEQRLQEKRNG